MQLKISLRGVKPPVWRRVVVNFNITLAQLHEVIQTAMGWTDSHLHLFAIDDRLYGNPEYIDDWPEPVHDEANHRLGKFATVGATFRYEYDFGDGWERDILVEKIEPGRLEHPVVLTGRRACPPEDCGGPWGYADLIAAVSDPNHDEPAELTEWAGPYFDPALFDRDATNLLLALEATGDSPTS